LHLFSEQKVKGLDPAMADEKYAGEEVGKVYESLYQYHYLKRPFVLIPNLAEAMPEYSKDGRTLTIKLKKGVLFHDDPCFKETNGKGREMTSDDVIYSYKRLADPKVLALGWWLFDDKIVGLNEWRDASSKAEKTDYSQVVEGLKALDRYTIQIKLKQPSHQFLYGLAMGFTSVIPREAVEYYGKEFLNHAVGTGPFRLVEFNGSSKIVYDRNPTYRKELYPSEGAPGDKEAGLLEDAGKPIPFVDHVVVDIITETQPAYLNLISGKIDIGGIPKDSFAGAVTANKELSPELKAKGLQLQKYNRLDTTFEAFNMEDPVLKNKYLRQAISLAVNADTIIDLFYNGRALPAQGPIPPDIVGYDPKLKNPYRQFNLTKAKELLAKAGYPDGKGLPPIEYYTIADTTSRQMAELLAKSMAAIGVKLKINAMSWPEQQAAVKNKKIMMAGFAWGADYPDGENFLQLFYSKNISPGPNNANYQNPEFDRLYEAALKLPEGAARDKLYHQMENLVIEDCPWIINAHRIGYAISNKWVKNYKPQELDNTRFKFYKVDLSLKNK
jgi:ABC-type transport system substrate-binding protein